MGEKMCMSSIDQLIETWISSWNTYDLSSIDRLFLNDMHLTYFSSEKQGVIKGFESVKEHHRGFGFIPGGKTSENKLWLEDIQMNLFESITVVTAIWLFQKPGKPVQRGPVTFVCLKTAQDYRFIHLNFSTYSK